MEKLFIRVHLLPVMLLANGVYINPSQQLCLSWLWVLY